MGEINMEITLSSNLYLESLRIPLNLKTNNSTKKWEKVLNIDIFQGRYTNNLIDTMEIQNYT